MGGYALGENWHVVEQYVGVFSRVVVGVLVAGTIAWVVVRVRQGTAGDTTD